MWIVEVRKLSTPSQIMIVIAMPTSPYKHLSKDLNIKHIKLRDLDFS